VSRAQNNGPTAPAKNNATLKYNFNLLKILRLKFNLPETENLKFLNNQSYKLTDFNLDFYDTPAMIDQNWNSPCFLKNRYVFTRNTCHGYHYVLCRNKNYHASAQDSWNCMKCDQKMDLYHFLKCPINEMSLIQASKWQT